MAKKKRRTLSDVAQEAHTAPLADATPETGSAIDAAARATQRRQAAAEDEMPEPKPKRLNVNLRPELYERFKRRCQQEDRAISDVVRDLVEAYLST